MDSPSAAAGTGLDVAAAYATHAAPLQRYLASLTRDRAAAEDLAQEAFLRLAREQRAGRAPDNVAGWLYRVAANLVASRARRAAVAERHAPLLEAGATSRSLEDEVIVRERAGAVRSALAGLDADDREILLLAAHGYRGPELAERLGKSQVATRTMLCRARAHLRHQI